jgi:alpha-1,2-mannosyltransferase
VRVGRRAGLVIAALSVVIWLIALEPWHWYMGDLVVYRGGGHALLHGLPVYSVVSGRHHLHFTYPPFATLLAAVLSVMPLALAKIVLSALSAAALLGAIWLFVRRVETESGGFAVPLVALTFAATIWLEPVRATFAFGQINAVEMFLVVGDILWLGRRRAGGVGIGLAAAIKLTPLAFVPYLLLTGRIRQGVTAIATFVLCVLAGLAIAPGASRTYWVHHRFLSAHRIGRVENASNQSVRGVLARLLRTQQVPGWWLAVAVVVLVAGLLLARAAHHNRRESQAIVVMAVAMLCASPVSWSHHWVWCALMAVACVDLSRRSGHVAVTALAVVAMLPFVLGLVFWPPHTSGLELHDSAFQQVLSASYVLAGLLLCALVARDLSSTADQSSLKACTPATGESTD